MRPVLGRETSFVLQESACECVVLVRAREWRGYFVDGARRAEQDDRLTRGR